MKLTFDVVGMVLMGIPAMVLHECGHILMAKLCGVKVKRIGFCRTGFYTVRETGPKWANLSISLAGPMMNLLLAIALRDVLPVFAFVNLIAALFNLLPIPQSDGRRILRILVPARPIARAVPRTHVVVK